MPSEHGFGREIATGPGFRKEFVTEVVWQIRIDSLMRLKRFRALVALGKYC